MLDLLALFSQNTALVFSTGCFLWDISKYFKNLAQIFQLIFQITKLMPTPTKAIAHSPIKLLFSHTQTHKRAHKYTHTHTHTHTSTANLITEDPKGQFRVKIQQDLSTIINIMASKNKLKSQANVRGIHQGRTRKQGQIVPLVPSLVAQRVKHLLALWVRSTWVRSPDQEEPLEKEMATHSITLAWKIPWTEKPGRLQSRVTKSRTRLSNFTFGFKMLNIGD